MRIWQITLCCSIVFTAPPAVCDTKLPTDFWVKSLYSNARHPPATETEIRETERRLGVTFPPSFRELYQQQNGGGVMKPVYHDKAGAKPEYPLIDGLMKLQGLESMKELAESIDFGDTPDWTRFLKQSEKLIVLSRHGIEVILCFDYRKNSSEPEVVLYETFDEPKEVLRTTSFSEFLKRLAKEE